MLNYKEQFSEYFEKNMPEILKSLDEIISIKSVADTQSNVKPFGEGCKKALSWGESFMKSLGMNTVNVDGYAVHGDFFDDSEPALAVLSHLDTVPEGEGWSFPPFALTVKDNVLYGRGTIDDKGPSVAVLYAVKAIKDLNIPIKKNFRVVFGGYEEGGCEDISYYQSKFSFPPMVFTPDGSFPVLNCEKGLCHLQFEGELKCNDKYVKALNAGTVINAVAGKADIELVGINEQQLKKSFAQFGNDFSVETKATTNGVIAVITGKSSHGSRPENGINTASALIKVLCDFNLLGFDKLEKVFKHNDYSGKAAGLGFSDEISGDMTCVLTQLNVENNKLVGGVDIRFPIDKTSGEIVDIITKSLENADMKVVWTDTMEPHYVDEKSEFVQTLLRVYEGVSGEKGKCIAEGGITYVHDTEGAVAFGAEFPEENNNMHGADEHISMKTFMTNLNMYANAIVELTK